MIKETDSRLIDKYVREGLTDGEQAKFDRLMTTSTFAGEVAFRERLGLAIRDEGRSKLKKLFKQLDSELEEEEGSSILSIKQIRFKWYRWSGIAAVILVLMAFFLRPNSLSNQEIFDVHYQAFDNFISPSVRNQSNLDVQAKALIAYETKNYPEAIRLFETLDLDQNERIYYGLSLLGNGEHQVAIEELTKVGMDEKASYHQAAQWYLSLAYIKMGDRKAAQSALNTILKNKEHKYYNFARELKKDL